MYYEDDELDYDIEISNLDSIQKKNDLNKIKNLIPKAEAKAEASPPKKETLEIINDPVSKRTHHNEMLSFQSFHNNREVDQAESSGQANPMNKVSKNADRCEEFDQIGAKRTGNNSTADFEKNYKYQADINTEYLLNSLSKQKDTLPSNIPKFKLASSKSNNNYQHMLSSPKGFKENMDSLKTKSIKSRQTEKVKKTPSQSEYYYDGNSQTEKVNTLSNRIKTSLENIDNEDNVLEQEEKLFEKMVNQVVVMEKSLIDQEALLRTKDTKDSREINAAKSDMSTGIIQEQNNIKIVKSKSIKTSNTNDTNYIAEMIDNSNASKTFKKEAEKKFTFYPSGNYGSLTSIQGQGQAKQHGSTKKLLLEDLRSTERGLYENIVDPNNDLKKHYLTTDNKHHKASHMFYNSDDDSNTKRTLEAETIEKLSTNDNNLFNYLTNKKEFEYVESKSPKVHKEKPQIKPHSQTRPIVHHVDNYPINISDEKSIQDLKDQKDRKVAFNVDEINNIHYKEGIMRIQNSRGGSKLFNPEEINQINNTVSSSIDFKRRRSSISNTKKMVKPNFNNDLNLTTNSFNSNFVASTLTRGGSNNNILINPNATPTNSNKNEMHAHLHSLNANLTDLLNKVQGQSIKIKSVDNKRFNDVNIEKLLELARIKLNASIREFNKYYKLHDEIVNEDLIPNLRLHNVKLDTQLQDAKHLIKDLKMKFEKNEKEILLFENKIQNPNSNITNESKHFNFKINYYKQKIEETKRVNDDLAIKIAKKKAEYEEMLLVSNFDVKNFKSNLLSLEKQIEERKLNEENRKKYDKLCKEEVILLKHKENLRKKFLMEKTLLIKKIKEAKA